MKKLSLTIATLTALAISSSAFAADTATTANNPQFKTSMDKVSYSIGYQFGETIKEKGVGINNDLFISGFNSGTKGEKPALTKEQMQQVMQAFQEDMMKKAIAKQKELADVNAEKSKAFIAKVSKENGVLALTSTSDSKDASSQADASSGTIYYKVDTKGKGNSPTENDQVVVTYKGTLPDGTVFDQTQPGKTATFPVKGVIPGFQTALMHMNVGSTWTVYIPADQAYGQYAPSAAIGPNQALTFEVTLKKIIPSTSTTAKTDDTASTQGASGNNQ